MEGVQTVIFIHHIRTLRVHHPPEHFVLPRPRYFLKREDDKNDATEECWRVYARLPEVEFKRKMHNCWWRSTSHKVCSSSVSKGEKAKTTM